MAELANGGPQEGEELSDAQPEGDEQEATLIKKSVKLESQLGEDANKENVDDKTEDQVPDITNNEDPMTTSMDGIEEISANEGEEVAKDDAPAEVNGEAAEVNGGENAKQNGEAGAEDQNTEQDVAEIPVNVYDGGEEGEGEKPAVEEEPKAEDGVEETGAEQQQEEEGQQEAEQPEAEQPTEAEEQQPPAAEEEAAAEEPKAEEQEEEVKEVEEEPFELQAPPVPKRPRTPNEMDEAQDEAAEQPVEEAQPAENEAAPEPEQPVMTEVPIEVEGLPSTPKSQGSRRGSGGSVLSGGSKLGADAPGTPKEPSVVSPVPATPKSGGTTTPKSTRSGRGAFDFGIEPAKKKTTFEDEVLSVKSSKSRSPRSPRSPRTRKAAPEPPVEEPKPEEEAAPKEEAAAVTDEEEKLRQASFEERFKEREEEEDRWKRMTSWDRGEDGTGPRAKEEAKEPEAAIEEEEGKPAEAAVEGEEQPQVEDVPVESEEQPREEAEAEEPTDVAAEPPAEAEQPPADEAEETQEKLSARGDEVEGSPPPPPPRPERSPSPVSYRREPSARSGGGGDYLPYDQELKGETVPARMTADESFSSWAPVERESYKPISPWVDRTSKYRNEYTVGEPPVAPSAYTAFFDDLVSSGPFASSLYSTSRLLERSRSRTRERRQALRSQSSARNYFRSVMEERVPMFLYRFASQHPAPLRSRDYSTPPSSMVSRAPTSPGSFVSFMNYAGAKQYEMARSQSLQRGPLYQSNLALSRSISRGGIDYYLGSSSRPSRVDSYVDSLHRPYEWSMPSNYEQYRASSRGQVGYAPLSNYQSHVDTLQRSLSRERYERDRLRNKYTTVSYQLEQACKQMDLLRSHNYSALRSGSAPRTSVYAHFYPYY